MCQDCSIVKHLNSCRDIIGRLLSFFSPLGLLFTLITLIILTVGGAFFFFIIAPEKSIGFELVSIAISLVTIIFTGIAIFVACRINESVQAAEGTKIYFSSEMRKSIRDIAHLKNELQARINSISPNTPQLSIRTKDNNHTFRSNHWENITLPWTEKEDNSRRIVKSYFLLLHSLRYERIIPISKYTFRKLCSVDAFSLFFEIIEPMESILNKNYNSLPFYKLMKDAGDILDRNEKTRIKNTHKFWEEKEAT